MRFEVNGNLFYTHNPYVSKNSFLTMPAEESELPIYKDIKDSLPEPIWDEHRDAIDCYHKAWRLAFGNLRKAKKNAGFVSNFIDTAFNGYLFMWDSSFIVMFGKYANKIFNFQKTLDNFYSHQHRDGFICREICETQNGEQFSRDDPASTGPNILAWAEWEYFLLTGDFKRLSKVFDPLCAYYRWLLLHRSWQDGSYWTCGLACGMDNQPRTDVQYDCMTSHGFMSWIDMCAQQYLSADILIQMAVVLNRESEVDWLKEEKTLLYHIINDTMWSATDNYYYDRHRDGSLTGVKSIASYWTLLANLVPAERIDKFVAHLENPNEFRRPNRIPTLSFDHPKYNQQTGGYWNGAVWAPTNYMVLCGLNRHHYHTLAHEIAVTCLDNVVEVFRKTGTLFENYAPETAMSGIAKPDFVGWTGLIPISIMFEYVFGIQFDSAQHKITWRVNLLERHGIKQFPAGDATVDLICAPRKSVEEMPNIRVTSDKAISVEVFWHGGSFVTHSSTP